jgi:catechol 2,3-dioxygenase-like lactoylglutathione lyase family enzyme
MIKTIEPSDSATDLLTDPAPNETAGEPVSGVLGLRHIHLRVRSIPAAIAFYEGVFSFRVGLTVRHGAMVFLQTVGGDDLLTLSSPDIPSELDGSVDQPIGNSGGLDHFGICVSNAAIFHEVIERVELHHGSVLSCGENHGAPTAFIRDLDGYALQVYVMPKVAR